MSNIAVIYQSNYGTTKKYAQWIAEVLEAELLNRKSVSVVQLSHYDIIIYGGGLYAGGILGVDLFSKFKPNHLVVFTVGLANPSVTDYTEIMAKCFSKKDSQPEKVFYFRGGIDYSNLNFVHRGLMAMLKKKVAKISKIETSAEGKAMLETYGKQIDFTDRETIMPLITYVKEVEE